MSRGTLPLGRGLLHGLRRLRRLRRELLAAAAAAVPRPPLPRRLFRRGVPLGGNGKWALPWSCPLDPSLTLRLCHGEVLMEELCHL